MEQNDYEDYWRYARERVLELANQDQSGYVFGGRYARGGHHYKILPVVNDSEIQEFENRNGVSLPADYSTFLRAYGRGGAGPYYGIADFYTARSKTFKTPFEYSASFWYTDDIGNDHPIWKLNGMMFLCSGGCGNDYYIQLNGAKPGSVWLDYSEGVLLKPYSFFEFFQTWLHRVDLGLQRFLLIKKFVAEVQWKGQPADSLFDYLSLSDDERRESGIGNISGSDENLVFLCHTPASAVVDSQGLLTAIEIAKHPMI